MKRNAPHHPKIDLLIDELDETRALCVGLMEMLWHLTAAYAPAGDIGRFTNKGIARRLEWSGDADKLIAAMVKAGLVDEHPDHRLIVHDWSDHADDAVCMRLARATEMFADGTMPRLGRFSAVEKQGVLSAYENKGLESVQTESTRDAHAVSTALALPSPAPPSPAVATTDAEPDGVGGSGGREERSSSGVGGSGNGNLAEMVQRAAERAGVNAHAGRIADLLRNAGVQADSKVNEIARRGDLTPDIVERTIESIQADPTARDPAKIIVHRLTTKTAAELERDIPGGSGQTAAERMATRRGEIQGEDIELPTLRIEGSKA